MKKLISLLFLVFPLLANAEEVEIDGLWYNLVPKAKQAEVIQYKNNQKYSGDIIIPDAVTYKNVKYNVTSIGERAFYGCSRLTSVAIPNSITSIGDLAFCGCSLTSVTIPNSVTNIGGSAFYACKGLTSFTIPSSVTTIRESAFGYCSSLTSVTIPNSVTSIGVAAFYDCSSLTSVIIPNSVTSIGERAFDGCSSLTSVTIGNSVATIRVSAFSGCSNLTSVTIGNSVTSIGECAFWDCSSLTSITIPNSVTSIGERAFYGCTGLTSVTIGNSVTTIRESAFYGCSSLTSVTIPNSVTSIGEGAFSNSSNLTSVTIGSGIRNIGSQAFANCQELLDVYCYAEAVPSTQSNAFDGSYLEYATLHVPSVSLEAYKSTSPWSDFGTFKTLNGEIPEVKKCATPTIFYNNGELTFESETEGATCVATISDTDMGTYSSNRLQLSVTYHISVYATKSGYQNSDVAEATLCWIEVAPQTEGISEQTAGVKQLQAMPVLIQAEGGEVSVDGAPEGTRIAVYDASGVELGSAIIRGGKTMVPAHTASSSIAIVKIGERSFKVAMK